MAFALSLALDPTKSLSVTYILYCDLLFLNVYDFKSDVTYRGFLYYSILFFSLHVNESESYCNSSGRERLTCRLTSWQHQHCSSGHADSVLTLQLERKSLGDNCF